MLCTHQDVHRPWAAACNANRLKPTQHSELLPFRLWLLYGGTTKEQQQAPLVYTKMQRHMISVSMCQDSRSGQAMKQGAGVLCRFTWSAAAGAQQAAGAHSSTGHNQPFAHPSQPPTLLPLRPAVSADEHINKSSIIRTKHSAVLI